MAAIMRIFTKVFFLFISLLTFSSYVTAEEQAGSEAKVKAEEGTVEPSPAEDSEGEDEIIIEDEGDIEEEE